MAAIRPAPGYEHTVAATTTALLDAAEAARTRILVGGAAPLRIPEYPDRLVLARLPFSGVTADTLRRALHDTDDDLALRPLPAEATALLIALQAPPRLAAHLRAVHDVAAQLLDQLRKRYPALAVDEPAVLFGAAIHDIGKITHPEELTGPGSHHEPAGYQLLLAHGVAEHLARFAATHAHWNQGISTEELLVSLADKIWKGKRQPDLEQLVVDRLANLTGELPWETFMALDDIVTCIAADADPRLAFQTRHPPLA